MSNQLQKYLDSLDECKDLEKNWDSYGADPINPDIIDTVRQLLTDIFEGHIWLGPNRNGGIEIEGTHSGGYQYIIDIEGPIIDLDAAKGEISETSNISGQFWLPNKRND